MEPSSFHNLKERWLPEIQKYNPKIPIVLVGTHCDLRSNVEAIISLKNNRLVPIAQEQADTFAKRTGALCYVETSALTQKNVKTVFDEAIGIALSPHTRRHPVRITKPNWTKCILMWFTRKVYLVEQIINLS